MPLTTVLSPHPDDAVLSLWHLLAGEGDLQVVNLFAGTPNGHPVGVWDRLTGVEADPGARAAERRAEDRRALALAGRIPLNLEFLDAAYRDGMRPFSSVLAGVMECVCDSALVLAPAALGTHTDHRLARDVALELRRRGTSVALYADVPHATAYGWPGWVTGKPDGPFVRAEAAWEHAMRGTGISLRDLGRSVVALSGRERGEKLAAVGCYRTQVAALDEMFSILRRPELLGHEVVWTLPPA